MEGGLGPAPGRAVCAAAASVTAKTPIRQEFCLQSHLFLKLLATHWEQGTKDECFLLPSPISLLILFSYLELGVINKIVSEE